MVNIRYLFIVFFIMVLTSCSQGSRNYNHHDNNIQLPDQPVVFVSSTAYYYNQDVLNKSSSNTIKVPFYMLNTAKVAVNSIAYSAISSAQYIVTKIEDPNNCQSSIAAGAYCKLILDITLSSGIYNGSVVVNANYSINNKSYSISMVQSFNGIGSSGLTQPVYDNSLILSDQESTSRYFVYHILVPGVSATKYTLNYSNSSYTVLDANYPDNSAVYGGSFIDVLAKPLNLKTNHVTATKPNLSTTNGGLLTLTNSNGTPMSVDVNIGQISDYLNSAVSNTLVIAGLPSIISSNDQDIIIINYNNIGSYTANLSSFTYNHSTLAIESTNCGNSLNSFSSCSVIFKTLTASGSESVTLNYTNPNTLQVTISSLNWYDPSLPILIASLPTTINISGGIGLASVPMIITNYGQYNLTNISYTGSLLNGVVFFESNSLQNCATIESGASCIVTTQLLSNESGIAPMLVNITGNYLGVNVYTTGVTANVLTSSPNYQSASTLVIESIQAQNYLSGSGLAADPYIFMGNNGNTQQITITYGLSFGKVLITNVIQNMLNSLYWQITSDNCTGAYLANTSDTCNIVYKNIFYQYSGMTGGVTSDFSFNLPSMVYVDYMVGNSDYLAQPLYNNQAQVNVTESMAMLNNSASIDQDGNLVITQVISNFTNYPQINFDTDITGWPVNSLVSQSLPTGVSCSYVNYSNPGPISQTCVFNPTQNSSDSITVVNTYSLLSSRPADSLMIYFYYSSSNNVALGANVLESSL